MSEPKRYHIIADCGWNEAEAPDGEFVRYEDYARLKAEVERLTKAGDAMAVALNLNDDVFDNHEKKLAQSDWNAAKENPPHA